MRTKLLVNLGLAFAALAAQAQTTPVGLWKTIDDNTRQERSLIRITEAGGVLTGRIEKSLAAETEPSSTCDKCSDERKGKPLMGMAIIRNVKHNVDDRTLWDGGDITDPDNGKVYKLRLKPVEDGRKLEVRGYIGPFYRTQIWLRAE